MRLLDREPYHDAEVTQYAITEELTAVDADQ
jgi:hypothetical protein